MRLPPVRTPHATPPIGGEDRGPQGLPGPLPPSPSMRRTDWLTVIVLSLYVAFAIAVLSIGFGRQRAACLTIGHVMEMGCREER